MVRSAGTGHIVARGWHRPGPPIGDPASVECLDMDERRRGSAGYVAWCALLIVCGAILIAPDRPAIVMNPEGSPVWLDSQRSIFFDSPAVAVMVRNEHDESVNYALRIWIFDERSRLKGTQDFCTFDALGSHTRGRVLIPLDFRGV